MSAAALVSSAISAVDELSSLLGATPHSCSCTPCRCPPPCPCEKGGAPVAAEPKAAAIDLQGTKRSSHCKCEPECRCSPCRCGEEPAESSLPGATSHSRSCPCEKGGAPVAAEAKAVPINAQGTKRSSHCKCEPECRCSPCRCGEEQTELAAGVSEEQVKEFGRALLAAAVVVEAAPLEGSDKLYLCQVDCGEEKPRQVVTGLQKFVPLETLTGARVMVILNLKPAKLAGAESTAMILCGSSADRSTVVLSQVPEDSKPGDRVFIDGYTAPNGFDKKLSSKVWPNIQQQLKVGPNGEACYRGCPIVTPSGPVLVSGVESGSTIS